MFRDIDVTLTIKDNTNNTYLTMPVLPAAIGYTEGDRKVNTVSIIELGDVDFLNGVALDTMSWDSFFPKYYDPGYCKVSSLLDPLDYKKKFVDWKNAGTSLQLICAAAGINKTVYVKGFSWKLQGSDGDIYYSVSFVELKTVRPIQIPVTVTARQRIVAANPPASRPAVAAPAQAKTYTVVSGDYLIKIAKKLGIKDWHTIYNNNRDKIKNPNLIFPGQVLNIP